MKNKKHGKNKYQSLKLLLRMLFLYKLDYFIVFIISFILFSWLFYSPVFPDPDSFYHAKIASLTKSNGPILNFPWLEYTTLKESFADHHFLYHVLIVPFIYLFKNLPQEISPLIALKFANIFFNSLFIILFYWFLKNQKIKGAIFYTLLLITINPFIYRLSLAKAQPLSLIILILSLYLIFNKKHLGLFALSFLYVWTYGAWPLILIFTGLYVVINGISKANIKLFLNSFLGLFCGLILNPYFPNNLNFYYQQIIEISVKNYQKIINVGGEWYPYKLIDLLIDGNIFFVLYLLSCFIFLIFTKKQHKKSIFFFIISILFLFLTLKSRRNIEYLVPFGLIFASFSFNNFLKLPELKTLYTLIRKKLRRFYTSISLILIIFILFLVYFSCYNVHVTKKDLEEGFNYHKFQKAGLWLAQNTPKKSIVFHSDWDDFPMLFYHNHHNKFIVGLDPTFMLAYDKDLYWKWHDITTGEKFGDIYKIIKKDFNAPYVIIGKDNETMNENIKNTPGFKIIYEDEDAWIYKL